MAKRSPQCRLMNPSRSSRSASGWRTPLSRRSLFWSKRGRGDLPSLSMSWRASSSDLRRGEREFWLQAWNGGAHIVERIGREPVAVEHLLVGLTGGLQPDKLERAFGGDEDGFYARILFAWTSPPSYFPLANDVPEEDPKFREALMRLIQLPDGLPAKLQPRELNLDEDALCTLEDFRRANRVQLGALEGRERDWIAKGPGQVLRLAGVLVYLEWALQGPQDHSQDASGLEALRQIAKAAAEPTVITGDDMRKAIALFDNYFWPHARAALRQIGLSDRHREERRVLRWARAKKIETLSRETIRREIFSQRIDAERAQAIIDALVEAGWLREVTMKGHQHRPARRWQVNPLLGAGRSGRLRGPWRKQRKQRERTETKVPAVPAILA